MKAIKRIGFQLLFWSVVWLILALGYNEPLELFSRNWVICCLQFVLIVTITLTLAPKVLSKKNTTLFTVLGVALFLICALFAYQFSSRSPGGRSGEDPKQQVENHISPERDGSSVAVLDENAHPIPRPPSRRERNLTSFGQALFSPFLINFLLLCLTVIISIVVETFLFAKRKEEDLILSKSETLETELKLLKSQINPHFLFNSLNNIYALSAIDTVKTQESIHYLSSMLRYVLYECERPFVPIQKEVDYINDYIKLFALKSSKKYPIETHFVISDPTVEIAPMLLIPFVENAFKHSNIERVEEAFVRINLNATRKEIGFRIENTMADTTTVKDEVGGIGLGNVRKRLSILYPERHHLVVSEKDQVFSVTLNLENND